MPPCAGRPAPNPGPNEREASESEQDERQSATTRPRSRLAHTPRVVSPRTSSHVFSVHDFGVKNVDAGEWGARNVGFGGELIVRGAAIPVT